MRICHEFRHQCSPDNVEVLFLLSLVTFSEFLPHSLTPLEVIAAGNLMKHTVTFSKLVDLSGFEHCWKHLE